MACPTITTETRLFAGDKWMKDVNFTGQMGSPPQITVTLKRGCREVDMNMWMSSGRAVPYLTLTNDDNADSEGRWSYKNGYWVITSDGELFTTVWNGKLLYVAWLLNTRDLYATREADDMIRYLSPMNHRVHYPYAVKYEHASKIEPQTDLSAYLCKVVDYTLETYVSQNLLPTEKLPLPMKAALASLGGNGEDTSRLGNEIAELKESNRVLAAENKRLSEDLEASIEKLQQQPTIGQEIFGAADLEELTKLKKEVDSLKEALVAKNKKWVECFTSLTSLKTTEEVTRLTYEKIKQELRKFYMDLHAKK